MGQPFLDVNDFFHLFLKGLEFLIDIFIYIINALYLYSDIIIVVFKV